MLRINQQIDRIADDFEASWRTGQAPKLAEYVTRIAAEHRDQLLAALIPLDIDSHRQHGCAVDLSRYAELGPVAYELARHAIAPVPSDSGYDETIAPASETDAATQSIAGNESVLLSMETTVGSVPSIVLREPNESPINDASRTSSSEQQNWKSAGRYQLHGEIARGGMGAILKGRDTDLGRDLAIKVLLDGHKDNPQVIQRFIEEAQIGGQLQHPGIAPVYELGQFADKRPFFSMKLVKGETLSALLSNRNDVNEDRAKFIGIFEQICQTMAYAHSRGVIHRDLKPANIMVGAFGEVQVMDWGLAKVLPVGGIQVETKIRSPEADKSIIQTMRSAGSDTPAGFFGSTGSTGSETAMGSVMGTPAYMPPEQALGEIDRLDERSDVFGLGAILCEILTGKPPYVGRNGNEVYRLASRGKLDDCFARLEACGAGEELITLTRHCLELEPNDRPRDAKVLSDQVSSYVESVDTKLRAAERERADAEIRAEELRRRQRVTILSGLAIALALIVGIGASSWQAVRALKAERIQAELRGEAEVSATRATQEAIRASEAEQLATQREVTARKALTRSALSLAEAAYREDDGFAMEAALQDVPEDLRDSTWNYLHELSDSSIARLQLGDSRIVAVAADPTRKSVFAIANEAGDVAIIQLPTGERLLEFKIDMAAGTPKDVSCLAFSGDGHYLAIGRNFSSGIGIYRTSDGGKDRELPARPTHKLEFSGPSKLISMGRSDAEGTLQVWDLATSELKWHDERPGNIGVKAIFMPGGNELSTFNQRDLLQIVSYFDGSVIRNLGGRTTSYHWYMAVHPDGQTAVTCTEKQITECVSLIDGKTIYTIPDKKRRYWLSYLRGGSQFVSTSLLADGRQSIEIWNADSGNRIRSILGGRGDLTQAALHPLSNELVNTGAETRAWDVTGPIPKWALSLGYGTYYAFSFWGTGDLVLSSHEEPNDFGLKQLVSEGVSHRWTPLNPILHTTASSPDLIHAAISHPGFSFDIQLLRRDGISVSQAGTLKGNFWPYSMQFSRSGQRLVARERPDYLVKAIVFDVKTGKELSPLDLSKINRIGDLQWIDDVHLVGLVTKHAKRGHPDAKEEIIVFDTNTGKITKSLVCPTPTDALVVASDGRQFAEAGTDKMVRIRDSATLEIVKQFRAHDAAITTLAWHPTQNILATGAMDCTAKLWDLESLKCIKRYAGMLEPLVELEFSPDGRRFAANSRADNVRSIVQIWDVYAHEEIADQLLDSMKFVIRPKDYDAATSITNPWTKLVVARHLANQPMELEQLFSEHPEVAAWEGDFESSRKDWDAAMDAYSRLIDAGKVDSSVLAKRASCYAETRQWDKAEEDLALALEKAADVDKPALAIQLTETQLRSYSDGWEHLVTNRLHSEGGAALVQHPDGIIVAAGENPNQDVYELVGEVPGGCLSGVRLEVFMDDALVNQGPGRSDNGNACLTELRVEVAPLSDPDEWTPLALSNAYCNEPADFTSVALAIDGHDDTWWDVIQDDSLPVRIAIFEFDRSIQHSGPVLLRLRLQFQSPWPAHQFGKVRLSVWKPPRPFDASTLQLDSTVFRDPWHKLVTVYQAIGKEAEIHDLVAKHPAAHAGLAEFYAVSNDWPSAIESYSRLLQNDANNSDLLSKRAAAYMSTERWDMAKEDWHRAAKLNPNVAHSVALKYCELQRWSDAVEFGQLAIEHRPDNPDYWLRQAALLVLSNNHQRMKDLCGQMLKQFPSVTDSKMSARITRVGLMMPSAIAIDRLPTALFVDELESGKTYLPWQSYRWGLRGLLAFRDDDPESAIQFIKRSQQLSPDSLSTVLNIPVYAMALHRLGNTDRAKTTLDAAAKSIADLKQTPSRTHHDLLVAEALLVEATQMISPP